MAKSIKITQNYQYLTKNASVLDPQTHTGDLSLDPGRGLSYPRPPSFVPLNFWAVVAPLLCENH